MPAGSPIAPSRAVLASRIGWAILTLVLAQVAVCGLAAAPAVFVWQWLLTLTAPHASARLALMSVAIVPSYVLLALCLMVPSRTGS